MPIRWVTAAAALAVVVCAASSHAGPIPRDAALRVSGTVTAEGVECPALRGDDGQLYTLTGDLAGASIGDTVCIEGRLVEISICQQGTTLRVERIEFAACGE